VTFYTGESPVRGDSVAQIRGALQDLLRSNGIPGKVAEMPSSLLGQKFNALLFYVDGISLQIKDITFSGESAISDKQLSDAAAGLRNQNFSNTNVALYASATLLPLYYRRGYLRSQFGRAGVSVIDPNSKGPVTDVSVTFSVVEGNQYFWSGVSWSGNQALSASDLGKVLEMNPKDVANQEKIDTGFANARKTYESQGFINVRITPTRNLDDAVRLASYSVRIDEGDQFHMGKVYFDGLPERVAAALLKKWKLKPGDVYDESYPADFLKDVAPKELAQQGGGFHVTSMKQDADANRLIVDVHFGFH
jgi:outer membrane protein insertion porin family